MSNCVNYYDFDEDEKMRNSHKLNEMAMEHNLEITNEEFFQKVRELVGEEQVIANMLVEHNAIQRELNDADKRNRMLSLRMAIDILQSKKMVGNAYSMGRVHLLGDYEMDGYFKVTGYDEVGNLYGLLVAKTRNGNRHIVVSNYHVAFSYPFQQLLDDDYFQEKLDEALTTINVHRSF